MRQINMVSHGWMERWDAAAAVEPQGSLLS